MQKITKVVIPIAGMGTRFLPITKSIPKEMLPIIDKPCIQYIVEEAESCGIKEIIFVNSPEKEITDTYFRFSQKLDSHLRKQNKNQLANDIKKIDKIAEFQTVLQHEAKGDGHAILQAKKHIKNEPFAVLFGDDIWDSKTPPLAQLLKIYEKTNSPVVSLEQVPKNETHKYGIISPAKKTGRTYEINGFIEKPNPSNAPSNLALTGKYIVTPELFEHLENFKTKSQKQEIRLVDAMINFVKTQPIYGVEIQGKRFDTGDKLGFLKATVHFALKDKTLGKDFKNYLKNL